jgi:hypothetical protein
MSQVPLNIGFRKALTDSRAAWWLHLCNDLIGIQLSDLSDAFKWKLTKSGAFTSRSMYLDYMDDHTKFLRTYIWKIKVSVKIFSMWFLYRKILLTKHNLAKWNWQGSQKYCFCDHKEPLKHLFISCPLAKSVQRIVHMAINILPPTNIMICFKNWLLGVTKKDKVQIRVSVCALLWTLWNIQNDYILNNTKSTFI